MPKTSCDHAFALRIEDPDASYPGVGFREGGGGLAQSSVAYVPSLRARSQCLCRRASAVSEVPGTDRQGWAKLRPAGAFAPPAPWLIRSTMPLGPWDPCSEVTDDG